jgi:hypothetical protein
MTNEPSPMSFREKSAWISLLTLAAVFVLYFANYARMMMGYGSVAPLIPLIFSLVAALIVSGVVLHLVIAIRSPKEARTPKDERERLIELKATRVAFFVLIAGALATIFVIHLRFARAFDRPLWMLHTTLFFLILAGIVKFASQIVLYRRDA